MSLPDAASEAALVIRKATPDDVALIIHQRRSMFLEMGYKDPAAMDAMAATSGPFIKNGLREGFYRGWLAEQGGRVVAGGGLMIIGHPSSPRDPSPRRAWIINMYTEPAYRGRGLAKSIVNTITAWCREEGFVWVSLHASEAGWHLYENLGFKPTNELRLELK